MRETLLKTEKLSKSFSNGGAMQHVLKNIDLELYQGDFTVIMGASGAGKSTLLYALSGMDTPTLGTITFGDQVISDLNSDGLAVFRRRHCGFVFQQIYLIDGMSVMDNVLSAGLLVSKDKNALLARAKELFQAVDIPEETQRKFPAQLSGGECQRGAVARALINNPGIILADEPSGSLDSANRRDLHSLFFNLRDTLGATFVIVTHDENLAADSDIIVTMADGKIKHTISNT